MKKINPINYPMVARPHEAIYRMHQYRARKPENIVRQYIEHYTNKNEIVFDPFVGSGVTAIEAIRLERKAIALDLDPIAILITRVTAKPIDLKKVDQTYKNIKNKIDNEIGKFFETECKYCHNLAKISHVVWEINEPKEIWYDCLCKKKRQHKKPNKADLKLIEDINNKKIPYWYPKTKMSYNNGSAFLKAEKTTYIYELFTKRNLYALSLIYQEIEKINDKNIKDLFKFAFSGNLAISSKLNRKNVGGYSSKGRGWTIHSYWVPDEYFEQNVLDDFERRFQKIILKYKKVSH